MTVDLGHLFTYHPPTEEKAPLYKRLSLDFRAAEALLEEIGPCIRHPPDFFVKVNDALKTFAATIVEVCPTSADQYEAIRCVRLARNGANAHLHAGPDAKGLEIVIARQQLLMARWQSAAAIALDGKG
jgi:hypothetical protein